MSDSGGERSTISDRLIEIFVVVLLGVTTLGTAWCSYQAYQWNGEQADLQRQSAVQRLEANRLFSLATQQIAYDAGLIADFSTAYRAKDEKALEFYRTVLMRPAFVPFLDKWLAEIESGGTPHNILEDKEYMGATMGPYQEGAAKSQELDDAATHAGEVSDRYLVTTILLAMGLFFGGITSSFKWPFAKLVTLALGVVVVGLGAARLVDLPVIW